MISNIVEGYNELKVVIITIDNEDRKIEFLFNIFSELNDHIRATDEKQIIIAGPFIALIAVLTAQLIDKLNIISWIHLFFLIFMSLIGFCVLMLQFWYREWKEHYLDICHNIASNFLLEEEFLPFWLRQKSKKRKFSADNFLLFLTFIINIGLVSYSLYLLWNLLQYSCYFKLAIIILISIVYSLLFIYAKKNLINRDKKLIA